MLNLTVTSDILCYDYLSFKLDFITPGGRNMISSISLSPTLILKCMEQRRAQKTSVKSKWKEVCVTHLVDGGSKHLLRYISVVP